MRFSILIAVVGIAFVHADDENYAENALCALPPLQSVSETECHAILDKVRTCEDVTSSNMAGALLGVAIRCSTTTVNSTACAMKLENYARKYGGPALTLQGPMYDDRSKKEFDSASKGTNIGVAAEQLIKYAVGCNIHFNDADRTIIDKMVKNDPNKQIVEVISGAISTWSDVNNAASRNLGNLWRQALRLIDNNN